MKKKQSSVVDVLKDAILSGNISSGTEMTQKELAESLGVSRMPVREALIILEYQGLMERLPNNHVRVTDFYGDYFHDVFSICAEIEEQALLKEKISFEEDDFSRYGDSLELFIHKRIAQGMNNAFLKKTLDTMIDTYIDYAVHCRLYDKKMGEARLRSAVFSEKEKRKAQLRYYFEELEKAIAIVRK